MMYILSKHVLRQHVGPFLFGFCIVNLLFMLNLVFKELGRILSKGLEFWIVVEFFALNLAWIVALAVPMAVLMACLMAFGQMSADNEITAIKASGISLYRITLPVLIAAILLCFFLIWFNNNVLPDTNHRLRLLARDITMKKPTVSLEPGYLYQDIPNMAIRVGHLVEQENSSKIREVFIQDKSNPGIYRTIVAEHGEIFVNKKTGLFQITLYNGEIHEINNEQLGNYTRIQFPRHTITIPIPNMVLERTDSEYRGDREQSSEMMRQEVENNRQLIQKRDQNLMTFIESQIYRYFPTIEKESDDRDESKISAAATPLLTEQLKSSSRVQMNLARQLRVHKNLLNRIKVDQDINRGYDLTINKLLVEIYKKYSIPFASIVFVFIGVPLGIMSKRGNMAVGGGISLLFFIIYWIFLIGGEELADRDMLSPFLAMWIANFIVGAFGIYLLIHTVKEGSFINFNYFARLIPKRLREATNENS